MHIEVRKTVVDGEPITLEAGEYAEVLVNDPAYRVCSRPIKDIACTADMVFRKAKIAVFIDGCFWRGCPVRYKLTKTNSRYWIEKIDRNIARDHRNTNVLLSHGWSVLRFWAPDETEDIAQQIASIVRQTQH